MQLLRGPVATAGVVDEGVEDDIQISYSRLFLDAWIIIDWMIIGLLAHNEGEYSLDDWIIGLMEYCWIIGILIH